MRTPHKPARSPLLGALPALAALLLAACASAPGMRQAQPKHGTDTPQKRIAVTAHPLASQAAADILDRGGSVIDAAIAAQMVLGLVEPHASGPGGGTLIMLWDAKEKRLRAYDGLSAAPAQVTASLRTDTNGALLPAEPSQRGGRSVGVPGTMPVFAMAHARHGKLPWADLVAPAIRAAEEGFAMPPYLHSIVALPEAAKNHPDMRALYFRADGTPHPEGSLIRNPDYAQTMRRIAADGPGAFLAGNGAKAIVEAAQRGFRPSLITEDDLRAYTPEEREPVCGPFLAYRVCTMTPPSFGGIVVLQVLQMVEARAGGRYDFANPDFLHLYAEAGRLAQADRRKYVGDPAFTDVPTRELTEPSYVKRRAALIDPAKAAAAPGAGAPVAKRAAARDTERATRLALLAPDTSDPTAMTSQMAFADQHGNVLSVTTTLNLNFGSRVQVGGFVLNNALTNFAAAPQPGEQVANRMQPRKRPVTSMAPTIVFDDKGAPVLAGGSAGGGPIVDYIATGLIEILANGRTPAAALSQPRITTAVPGKVQIERGSSLLQAAPALAAKGHAVEEAALVSGAGFIQRTPQGWIGAADPRRDGVAR